MKSFFSWPVIGVIFALAFILHVENTRKDKGGVKYVPGDILLGKYYYYVVVGYDRVDGEDCILFIEFNTACNIVEPRIMLVSEFVQKDLKIIKDDVVRELFKPG